LIRIAGLKAKADSMKYFAASRSKTISAPIKIEIKLKLKS
jgi:hypothetical protein